MASAPSDWNLPKFPFTDGRVSLLEREGLDGLGKGMFQNRKDKRDEKQKKKKKRREEDLKAIKEKEEEKKKNRKRRGCVWCACICV